MPQDLIKILLEAEILFSRGYFRDSLELIDLAEQIALENKREDVLAAVYITKGNNLTKLGDFENAEKYLDKSLEIFEILPAIPPLFFYKATGIARTRNSLATLFRDMGRLDEAKTMYERALGTSEFLLKNYPESTECQEQVAGILNNLAILLFNMDRQAEAKQTYERALETSEFLLKNYPESTAYQSQVAMTLFNLAILLCDMDRLAEAKQTYERALKIYEALLEVDPESPLYQSMVVDTLNNLAVLLRDMGKFEDARIRYDKVLEIFESLLKKEPENPLYQSKVIDTLNNLAVLLRDIGKFEEAIFRFEQALKIYDALFKTGTENSQYQLDLAMTQDKLGTLLRYTGQFEKAKIRKEQALKIYETLRNKEPENTEYLKDVAGIHSDLGNLLHDIGRFDEAKMRYEQSLRMFNKLLKNNPDNLYYQSEAANTQNNFGSLLKHMGRFEDAKFMDEQVLEILKSLLKNDPKNVQYQSLEAGIQINLGDVLRCMGKLEDAEKMLEKGLKFYENQIKKVPENIIFQYKIAEIFNLLGLILDDTGKFEDAIIKFGQALEISESLLDTNPENSRYIQGKASTLNNLGNLLIDMGKLEDAEKNFKQTLEIRKSLLKKDPKNMRSLEDVAGTYNDLGNLQKNMEKSADAIRSYEKALEMYQRLLNLDPENARYQSYEAMTQHNFSAFFINFYRYDKGKLISKGKIMLEQALKTRETLLKSETDNVEYRSNVAMTLDAFGSILMSEENFSGALEYYSKALDLISTSGDPESVYWSFWRRGRCYEMMNNLDLAYENYRESIELIEHIRGQISQEEYKLDILRIKEGVYSDMISLCIKKHEIGKAWEYVGLVKSRTLLEYMRLLELPSPKNIPGYIQKKEKKLLGSISILDRQARKAEKAGQVSLISQEIKEKQDYLDELYLQIEKYAPEYVDLRKGLPLRFEGITDLLNNQNKKIAFIEYYTTPEKVFIFALHSNSSQPKYKIVDLSYQQLLEYVNKYFNEVAKKPRIEQTWQKLAEHLIVPCLKYIKGCETLYLIPHGLLHYLPLHALSINGRYLIEDFPIAYAPSLATIKFAHRKGSEKLDSCLSLGFTSNENEKALFEGEAIAVNDRFRKGIASAGEPILDTNATTKRLKEEAVCKDIIHLSCHGYFDPKAPLNSGLQLYDGMLTVKNIFEMKIDVDLLVLSACKTGINEQKPGDELVGLTRAFLYAGASSIMVTLWSVNAASTLILIDNFYKKIIKEKMNKAQALQQAQVELMNMTAQNVIDYYKEAKNHQKESKAYSTHRLLDMIIANTRLEAGDFKEALKEYTQLRHGMAPDSEEYRQLTKIMSKCRMALQSPKPLTPDYGKHIYAHPYYWAPFVLVGDWK